MQCRCRHRSAKQTPRACSGQLISRRQSRWTSISTPSITTYRPSVRASSMSCSTRLTFLASVPIDRAGERAVDLQRTPIRVRRDGRGWRSRYRMRRCRRDEPARADVHDHSPGRDRRQRYTGQREARNCRHAKNPRTCGLRVRPRAPCRTASGGRTQHWRRASEALVIARGLHPLGSGMTSMRARCSSTRGDRT